MEGSLIGRSALLRLARQYSQRIAACQPRLRARVDKWQWWPQPCRLCGGESAAQLALCAPCLQDLPRCQPSCERCAIPLQASGSICGPCVAKPPPFDAAFAPLRYDYPGDFLLRRLKFNQELSCARILAGLMFHWRPDDWPQQGVLVPVPLHRSRLLERGYNQSQELANRLARLTGLAVDRRLLVRERATAPQVGLTASQRRGNVGGAFAVRRQAPQRVYLVDDVMTTGATAAACARALKKAGAEHVAIWCAARAEG